ncbi:hypothetical protein VUJ46_09105 [Chryseobacterium sp. MYb264]|uniref:hypothetical protein n=1 Tax=Chryseobacterium sp. MYb264 TaxID=2745153 RepID=UPI002E15D9F3|nr:hypothetical protein VUJ46_09105 [Chryseobacterium sp. MYb264]
MMSTSPPVSLFYTYSNGTFKCHKCTVTVKYTQEEIVEKLKQSNIIFDSIYPMGKFPYQRAPSLANENIHFYKINKMIIDQDTLRNLDFSMRRINENKTIIHFNGMDVNSKISYYQMDRKIKKYYKSLVLGEISGSLKK